MTIEQELLSQWLHEQTPEPIRALDPESLRPAQRAPDMRVRSARWTPLLAAAAVVAIIAALAVVLASRGPHRAQPPADRHSTTPTVTRAIKAIGPWDTTPIPGHYTSGFISVLATGPNSIYIQTEGPVQRINPTTGAVLASQRQGNWYPSAVTIAHNAMWAVIGSNSSKLIDIASFGLDRLNRTGSIPVTLSARPAQGSLAYLTSSADGRLLAAGFVRTSPSSTSLSAASSPSSRSPGTSVGWPSPTTAHGST